MNKENTIYINASDVAAFIGENPFVDKYQAMKKIWIKNFPENAEMILNKIKNSSPSSLNRENYNKNAGVIGECITLDKYEKYLKYRKYVNFSICVFPFLGVIFYFTSYQFVISVLFFAAFFTKYYYFFFQRSNNYEEKRGSLIKNRNTEMKYSTFKFEFDDTSPVYVKIGGRYDGTYDDVIVEVKMRTKKLLKYIPRHELIQCQIYLQLSHGEYSKLNLVERFGPNEIIEHEIEYDKKFFYDEIIENIKESVFELYYLCVKEYEPDYKTAKKVLLSS